jgi:hypothetical protein
LNAENRSLLLHRIPLDKEVVVWTTSGHEECYRFASEICGFMTDAGYRVFGGAPMPQMFIPQLGGVRVRIGERAEIDVGLMTESENARGSAGVKMAI